MARLYHEITANRPIRGWRKRLVSLLIGSGLWRGNAGVLDPAVLSDHLMRDLFPDGAEVRREMEAERDRLLRLR